MTKFSCFSRSDFASGSYLTREVANFHFNFINFNSSLFQIVFDFNIPLGRGFLTIPNLHIHKVLQ